MAREFLNPRASPVAAARRSAFSDTREIADSARRPRPALNKYSAADPHAKAARHAPVRSRTDNPADRVDTAFSAALALKRLTRRSGITATRACRDLVSNQWMETAGNVVGSRDTSFTSQR